MTDILLAVVTFLIVLGPLVLIHELGHFIAARLVGITVLEFGIGFPPRAMTLFEQGGTKFSLNWLPIGGFVRPLGEDYVRPVGEEASEKDRKAYEAYQAEMEALGRKVKKPKSVNEATPLQRIFFMVSGALMNFLGAFVLLVLAAMLGRPIIDTATVKVTDVLKDSPAAQAGLQRDDIILLVNRKRIKVADDVQTSMSSASSRLQITYKRNNKQETVFLEPANSTASVANGMMITNINKGSPAESVFKPQDRLIKVDGTDINTSEQLTSYVHEKAGTSIKFTIIRNGEQQVVEVMPRKDPPSGEGPLGIQFQPATPINSAYGFSVDDADPKTTRVEKSSLSQAITLGSQQFSDMVSNIIEAPVRLIRGTMSVQEARPVSVVGISQMGGQVAKQSIETKQAYPLLGFAAVISIALGITNLLPIPALDGGRILFVLIEILRGKQLDPEREGIVHFAGLVILLLLSLLLIVNDLIHPISLNLK